MKNYFLVQSVSLSFILLASCAGKPIAVPESTSAVARDPASVVKTYFTTDKKSVTLCGNKPNDPNGVAANYVGILALTARQTRVTIDTYPVEDYGPCEIALANESSPRGDWKGFYNAKKTEGADPAKQLTDAIQGLDPVIASELVPYFRGQRPRSWKEFEDRITSAAQEIMQRTGRATSWKQAVIGRYKKENISNLGLLPAFGCIVTQRDETMETSRDELPPARFVLEVRIGGGKLLPDECEKHIFSFNGTAVTGLSVSKYNVYHDSSGKNSPALAFNDLRDGVDATATFQGVRQAVQPEDYIEERLSNVVLRGSDVTLTLEHPRLAKFNRIPEFEKSCRVFMSASVLGRTSWWSFTPNPMKTDRFELLDGARTVHTIPGVTMKKDSRGVLMKSQIRYMTSFAPGCPFFSTHSTDTYSIGE